MNVVVFNGALIQRDYSTSDLPPLTINGALWDFEYIAAGGGGLSIPRPLSRPFSGPLGGV